MQPPCRTLSRGRAPQTDQGRPDAGPSRSVRPHIGALLCTGDERLSPQRRWPTRLERGRLVFDSDYVRRRMMKTRLTVGSDGSFVVDTRNRHEMALRWLDR